MSLAVLLPAITQALKRTLQPDDYEAALQLFDQSTPEDMEFLRRIAAQLEEAHAIMLNELPKVITTPVEQAKIVALIARAYVVEKESERIRTDRVRPLNNIVKATNDLFKTAFGPLLERYGKKGTAEQLDDLCRRVEAQRIQREKDESLRKQTEAAVAEAAAVQKAAEAKTEEARKAAMAEAEKASLAQAAAAAEAPKDQARGVKTTDGKVGYHKTWDFEVVDATQVPREYLMVNEAAIRHAIAAGKRDVPGINIFETEARRRGV